MTYGLAKQLYNMLTSIYAALFKTTSPLTFDWRTAEISEMLGRDPELIKSFCNIKTEMHWFRTLTSAETKRISANSYRWLKGSTSRR